jgi:xylose isomerase
MSDIYAPRPEDKFSFGLWTVANRGRDPFGDVVRDTLAPVDAVAMLGEIGAWGVNLHDNDLVPIAIAWSTSSRPPAIATTSSSRWRP